MADIFHRMATGPKYHPAGVREIYIEYIHNYAIHQILINIYVFLHQLFFFLDFSIPTVIMIIVT